MVGQLLPKRDLGGTLGSALGGGIQKGFENEFEYGRDLERSRADEQFQYQRNRSRLQQAFGELENLASDPEGSKNPYKILSKLGQAFAGIPGGQQVVSEVYPQMVRSAQKANRDDNKPKGEPIDKQQDQDTQYNDGSNPLVKNVNVSENGVQDLNNFSAQRNEKMSPQDQNSLLQARSTFGGDPQQPRVQNPLITPKFGEGITPKMPSPEEYVRELQAIYKDFDDPQLMKAYGDLYREGNEQKLAQFDRQLKAQLESERIQGEERNRRAERRQFVKERKNLSPEDESIFMKLGQSNLDAPTEDEWYRLTNNTYRKFEDIRDQVEKNSSRGFFNADNQATMKNISNQIKPLLDLGLYTETESMLANNDWGEAEIAQMINPLGQKVENQIASLPKLSPFSQRTVSGNKIETAPVSYIGTESYNRNLKKSQEQEQKTLNKYRDFLRNNIKAGTAQKPGTSLIGLRRQFEKKGVDWRLFRDLVNDVMSDGNIRLDEFQATQIGQLRHEPVWNLRDYFNPFKSKR